MLSRLFVVAVSITLLTASVANSQSISQLGGPANFPPADFTGQQFVDNNGCVFLRAGFGGTVNWVPRVTADRRPLCNLPPSFGAVEAADAVVVVAAPPPPITPPAPPRRSPIGTPDVGDPIPLVPMAPKAAQITKPTVIVADAAPATALTPGTMRRARLVTYGTVRLTNALPSPPKGYRLAWKDDRLNPLRGLGTPSGQAQQDQIWTRDIPATGVVTAPAVTQPRIALSTMSAPATQTGASYVQIGIFGQAANSDGVKARLTALGLPVSMRIITSKGRVLQVVYAGPFASLTESRAALATTRNAGFPDAILK